MRQVIVKKTNKINENVFSTFSLSLHEAVTIRAGLNKISLENPILIMAGGKVHWQTQLREDLVTAGIVLSGVYFKEKLITLYVFNTNPQSMEVPADMPLIELHAYETVSVRQVEHEFNHIIVIEKEGTEEVTSPEKGVKKKKRRSN